MNGNVTETGNDGFLSADSDDGAVHPLRRLLGVVNLPKTRTNKEKGEYNNIITKLNQGAVIQINNGCA
jgi:hypothetical protein